MLGLFGTLDLGSRALAVQQQEMEISGQNVSNVSNTSYAEEQLNIQESTPLETPIGEEGTGVQATSITEVRDALLDNQIQAEGSVTSSLTAQQTNLQNAEAYLDEQISSTSSSTTPDSANGLAADLSNLFGSFESLSTDPSDLSLRQTAVQSAQEIATQFNQVSSQLSGVRNDINTSIQNDVTGANQDLATIASLNQQIVAAQASGGTANSLVDQREATLEDLAGKVNISTSAQSNGAVDVSIGGVTMISGITNSDSLKTYDAGNGQLLIQAQNAGTPLSLSGGSIEGEITARDGALASLQSGVNTLATQLITNVNSIYFTGYDLNGNTGQDLFTGTGASDIGVNSAVVSDPTQFQASGTAGAAGDNTTVLALAQLANQNISGLNNQTFSENYAQTVSDLGNSISTVNDQLNSSHAVSQMLTSQRASESGVSIDTEMTNLIQYQKAYEAAAELITTLNQMMQTVVTMKSS
ncbi:MAG: flagellar hook-associated protein FlgK [Verrucomicrobiota bacterium]|jgi:flagellar hook-associated protein 1 FlgK